MKYEIISAFRDRRTGEQIDPGQPLPEGFDKDTIARLVQAQCLRAVDDEPTSPTAQPSGDSGGGLFPDGAAGDAAAGAAGQPSGGRRGRRAADTGNTQ
jgi:hypothetical protein